MEKVLDILEILVNNIACPPGGSKQPPSWARILQTAIHLCRFALICGQALAWMGVL